MKTKKHLNELAIVLQQLQKRVQSLSTSMINRTRGKTRNLGRNLYGKLSRKQVSAQIKTLKRLIKVVRGLFASHQHEPSAGKI